MNERRSARPSPHRSSSALAPANHSSDSASVRPRNRRLISTLDDESDTATSREASRSRRDRNLHLHDDTASPSPARSYGLLSAFSPVNSRSASPLPSERGSASPHRTNSAANLTNFFNDSLTQSWASIQGFTSSLISGDNDAGRRSQSHNRAGSRPGNWGREFSSSGGSKRTGSAWGPAPPKEPGLNDVGAGSRAERDAALKAAKRAMVLESHDGVNGGLDVSGKHKRRNSDESAPEQPQPQEYLVYIHKVEPGDTYAGLILRYQCREDAFRKANGLWTRDSVQVRKWLTIPIDACDIRGRPCDSPSWHNSHGVDLLAPTPAAEESSQATHDDFFSRPTNGTPSGAQQTEEEDKPWTHVRWVKIDSFPQPVEIARVARNAMGYFPPRRKKSIRTISTLSTPRQSLELYSNPPGSTGTSSRRQSSLGHRPQLSGTVTSSPGRGAASDGGETLPAWMRRPGGVGSMGMSTRAPGPDKDYLTTWTKKHLPGLTLEGIPSMSIMGSETARFGFKAGESSSIVENHQGDGRDASSTAQQGNGLDKAAAAVETWLRGALSRKPSTQLDRIRGTPEGRPERNGDLIELTDTASDDGGAGSTSLLEPLQIGSSSRNEGEGTVRGRMVAKGGKDD
ncbi:hypothetical protein F66182_2762 [Fusarium sp. NRRL 66182]|nr:hypothetical protein F66182_2762 [Fusarium sp. NRRL 66182]